LAVGRANESAGVINKSVLRGTSIANSCICGIASDTVGNVADETSAI